MKKRNSFKECFNTVKEVINNYIDYGKRIKKNDSNGDPPMDNDIKQKDFKKAPVWITLIVAITLAALSFTTEFDFEITVKAKASPEAVVKKFYGNKK